MYSKERRITTRWGIASATSAANVANCQQSVVKPNARLVAPVVIAMGAVFKAVIKAIEDFGTQIV
jgi:hypothetical protein